MDIVKELERRVKKLEREVDLLKINQNPIYMKGEKLPAGEVLEQVKRGFAGGDDYHLHWQGDSKYIYFRREGRILYRKLCDREGCYRGSQRCRYCPPCRSAHLEGN